LPAGRCPSRRRAAARPTAARQSPRAAKQRRLAVAGPAASAPPAPNRACEQSAPFPPGRPALRSRPNSAASPGPLPRAPAGRDRRRLRRRRRVTAAGPRRGSESLLLDFRAHLFGELAATLIVVGLTGLFAVPLQLERPGQALERQIDLGPRPQFG